MSDDTDSNIVHLPARDTDSGGMPEAPDGGYFFYSETPENAGGGVPPESPAETTMELPPVRGPISPETAIRETSILGPPDPGSREFEEGEYVQPRSLVDRLGDWLEYRLEVMRERHAGEASFREAEIARKTALLEARTAREVAMMEQNGKFHTAMMKAKADKTAARGKADADRSKSAGSGFGADKGRSKAGGGSRGSGSSSGSGQGAGSGRGSRANGSSGGSGRSSGGVNSPKGAGKGSDRSAGSRSGGAKGNEPSGGSKGRQNGSGGAGAGKTSTGKGSSGGSGTKGSGSSGSGTGGSKGVDGASQKRPASAAAERARGRQERAAARQVARQQRRSANQAANIADRSKDRDQDRAAGQAAREANRAATAERKAARKAKREAATAAGGRTTLGAAVAAEAQRRWDLRRAAAEKDQAAKAGKAKDATGGKASEPAAKKVPEAGPETSADDSGSGFTTRESEDTETGGEKPSDSSGKEAKEPGGPSSGPDPAAGDGSGPAAEGSRGGGFGDWFHDPFGRRKHRSRGPEPDEPPRGTVRPEDLGVTVDSPGRPNRPPRPSREPEEDYPDAVIIPDDPAAVTTGARSLPPAPPPSFPRPGTSRPAGPQPSAPRPSAPRPATPRAETAKENPVRLAHPRQTGIPRQHLTDITFDQFLIGTANIAVTAEADRAKAELLAQALGAAVKGLREMATDLAYGHNISNKVLDQISELADAASRMKAQADLCAGECAAASEAATLAAGGVANTYGQDLKAMEEAGLDQASAAAHHQ
ncbi:ATP/GTP-binding protein [Streptomyces sp. NPDC004667]|uniref:ATP/GTP-binding protein n=1 Tax=Streptomyces sp. NPDC004667 TaxID=3154285 RepID=UPI0033B91545